LAVENARIGGLILMPKSKPDQVIIHRIEFQDKEREILETVAMSKAVSNIALPAVAGAGVYAGYKVGKAAFGWADDIYDGLRDRIREQKNSGYTEYKNIFGLPGWGIWPGVI